MKTPKKEKIAEPFFPIWTPNPPQVMDPSQYPETNKNINSREINLPKSEEGTQSSDKIKETKAKPSGRREK